MRLIDRFRSEGPRRLGMVGASLVAALVFLGLGVDSVLVRTLSALVGGALLLALFKMIGELVVRSADLAHRTTAASEATRRLTGLIETEAARSAAMDEKIIARVRSLEERVTGVAGSVADVEKGLTNTARGARESLDEAERRLVATRQVVDELRGRIAALSSDVEALRRTRRDQKRRMAAVSLPVELDLSTEFAGLESRLRSDADDPTTSRSSPA